MEDIHTIRVMLFSINISHIAVEYPPYQYLIYLFQSIYHLCRYRYSSIGCLHCSNDYTDDVARFPLFKKALLDESPNDTTNNNSNTHSPNPDFYERELNPGQILHIPMGYWYSLSTPPSSPEGKEQPIEKQM